MSTIRLFLEEWYISTMPLHTLEVVAVLLAAPEIQDRKTRYQLRWKRRGEDIVLCTPTKETRT